MTAVEWLVSQLEKTGFTSNNLAEFYNDIEIAKEMEAEQNPQISQIRKAVANYMQSEGCSCCQSDNHEDNGETLAILLGVDKYEDGSGYDWRKYRG